MKKPKVLRICSGVPRSIKIVNVLPLAAFAVAGDEPSDGGGMPGGGVSDRDRFR